MLADYYNRFGFLRLQVTQLWCKLAICAASACAPLCHPGGFWGTKRTYQNIRFLFLSVHNKVMSNKFLCPWPKALCVMSASIKHGGELTCELSRRVKPQILHSFLQLHLFIFLSSWEFWFSITQRIIELERSIIIHYRYPTLHTSRSQNNNTNKHL